MFHCEGLISSEMRYPSDTSKKKKRYVTFKCSVCGKITEQIYMKSRYTGKCRNCVQHKLDTKSFILKSKEIHGDKYDYSKAMFLGVLNQITIICPIHGEFSQRVQEHLDGHGCLQCAIEQRKENYILPKETWIKRMENYPLISFKDTTQIRNYHGNVDLICKIHGEFIVQLGQVGKSKHLCKYCAFNSHQIQSIRPELIGTPTYLYYVYLPKIDMYKFGVTINKRNRFSGLGKVVLIADGIREYTEAIRLEHMVLTKLEKYRYKGRKLLIKNGSTELFERNVLKHIQRALQE